MYRRARETVVAAGFRISTVPPFDYMALPLFSLDRMWEHRCIPYHDNVSVLREAHRQHGAWMSFDDARALGLRSNRLLHESVHMLVRRSLAGGPAGRLGKRRDAVVDALLEESCANASERLVGMSLRTEEDRLVGEQLMYCTRGEPSELPNILDPATIFRVLVIGYLHANFLFQRMPNEAIDDAVGLVVPADRLHGVPKPKIRSLFRQAFGLSRQFRVRTTAIAFRMKGFAGGIADVVDFDFWPAFDEGTRHRHTLDHVTTTLTARRVSSSRGVPA